MKDNILEVGDKLIHSYAASQHVIEIERTTPTQAIYKTWRFKKALEPDYRVGRVGKFRVVEVGRGGGSFDVFDADEWAKLKQEEADRKERYSLLGLLDKFRRSDVHHASMARVRALAIALQAFAVEDESPAPTDAEMLDAVCSECGLPFLKTGSERETCPGYHAPKSAAPTAI